MNKKSITLVVVFCLLKSITLISAANESINPYLIYYGDVSAQSIPTLAEYDLIVLGRYRHAAVNGDTWGAIKAVSPSTKIYIYQLGPQVADNTDSYDVRALDNLGRYNVSRGSSQGSINGDHPDWFLKNSAGQRVKNARNSHVYQLDYGNQDVAAYWANHTLEDIAFKEWRADGVFIDEVPLCSDSFLKKDPKYVPVKYSNCEAWNKSMSDFVLQVSAELQKNGQQVMANIGNSFTEGGAEAWQSIGQKNSAPNIMHEEGAFAAAWGDKGVVLHWRVDRWRQQIDLPSRVNRHVAMVSHTDLAPGQKGVSWAGEPVSHSQIKRFAIGSYLLARTAASGPTTYFAFDDDRKARGSNYDRLISANIYGQFDIGVPVGKYEKKLADQDLFYRKYSRGYVYVNPSKEKITAIKAERDAAFSTDYSNARKVGSDWYFDLHPHDAVIIRVEEGNTDPSKQSTPPVPPVLQTN